MKTTFTLKSISFFILLSFLGSCKTALVPVAVPKVEYASIDDKQSPDAKAESLILPYRKQVDAQMNDVVGTLNGELSKSQPECTMGNFFVDAMHQKAKEYFLKDIDLTFANYGGLRIPMIPAGPVTRGTIFELMPFENRLIVIETPGANLPALFDLMAAKDGWPVNSGVSYQITKDKKAINIMIAGKPLDVNRKYWVASSDYIANGGDNVTAFIGQPRLDDGKLLRNALLEYVSEQTKANGSVGTKLEKRASLAE